MIHNKKISVITSNSNLKNVKINFVNNEKKRIMEIANLLKNNLLN